MIERPRGTRDFAPEEASRRRIVEEVLRRTLRMRGYEEVQTPTFEHLELFTLRSGPQIVEQLYSFEDKGGRKLTLRPELTAPVMRFFFSELSRRPRPLKLFYFGPCFRYEEPQKGRYREFFQLGVELLGPPNPLRDAEVFSLAYEALQGVGLRGFVSRIGHVGILRPLVEPLSAPPEVVEALWRAIDKDEDVAHFLSQIEAPDSIQRALETIPRSTFRLVFGDEEGVPRAFEEYLGEVRGILEDLPEGRGDRSLRALAELQEVLEILPFFGVREVLVDLGVVRGLEYYTGIVFEFEHPNLGAEKQIGGGGSYSLSDIFGREPVPSSGFALGFDRVVLALENEGSLPPPPPPVEIYVCPIGVGARIPAIEVATRLRRGGIAADVELMGRKISKALEHASLVGIPYVAILGEEEIQKGVITLRSMSSGEQKEIPRDRIVEEYLSIRKGEEERVEGSPAPGADRERLREERG